MTKSRPIIESQATDGAHRGTGALVCNGRIIFMRILLISDGGNPTCGSELGFCGELRYILVPPLRPDTHSSRVSGSRVTRLSDDDDDGSSFADSCFIFACGSRFYG
jgi:hypothetical protein